MKKGIFSKAMAVISAAAMLFTTACGSGTAQARSVDGDTVRIGWIHDLSGNNAGSSAVVSTAIEMATEDINARGGVLGKKLEVVKKDGASNTQNYSDAANELAYNSDVVAVFSSGTSASREAIRGTFEEAKLPYFYSSLYEGGVASDYNICTGQTPEQNVLPILEYIQANNLGTKIYLVAADYNFGQISGEWLTKYAEEMGFEIVGSEYIPLDVTQYGSTITNIIDSGAEIVWYDLVGSAALSFYEQYYNATSGLDRDILLTGGTPLISGELSSVDPKYLEGILVCSVYFEGIITEAADFEKRYYEKNSTGITDAAITAYASMMMWANACEIAGSFDSDAVMTAINSGKVSGDSGIGSTISIDPKQHHCNFNMYLCRMGKDKKMELIETYEDVKPTYLSSIGIDLSTLGEAPNKQFTPLDD
ncbi:ABC transporter substrate-binding protein [Butyrivibrio proteoclasticus]|uniref:ABC transporter substrate-binding protein n=1 Tax=Butyrivibrio proteoclasticus TaxID=43305 RepID=UPI00047870D9|nr:ABC transporter substrate-binding protein [Butyrivibrio proteoclasticus]